MSEPRVLVAITVYNGRAVVPAAVASAVRLEQNGCRIEVLVLDDCSPEPGWSDELRTLCDDAGVMYYRSPRNLGIPRNVNLGLVAAYEGGYDYVVICNSDVILPATLVSQMLEVARTDARIGSVTAWSNNVSVYSLPNEDPDRYLADQHVVDRVTHLLTAEFGISAMDIPAGISFCVLFPTEVLRTVGLMDPVYGRGYCEETDWTLRSQARGYRIVLAPSVFVYHRGRGSTEAAGLVAPGQTTVPANDAIVSMRYPLFRSQVRNFMASDVLAWAHTHAMRAIVTDGVRRHGYTLHLSWLGAPASAGPAVHVTVDASSGRPLLEMRDLGFAWRLALEDGESVATVLRERLGRAPDQVLVSAGDGRLRDIARELGDEGVPVTERLAYPQRV